MILNSQDENIQYTKEKEDEHKSLNFLEVRIINNQMEKYMNLTFIVKGYHKY